MFQPQYRISRLLLNTIKRITILVHELNKRQVSQVALAELLSEAVVTSAYASTSIEGNPLPLGVTCIISANREIVRATARDCPYIRPLRPIRLT